MYNHAHAHSKFFFFVATYFIENSFIFKKMFYWHLILSWIFRFALLDADLFALRGINCNQFLITHFGKFLNFVFNHKNGFVELRSRAVVLGQGTIVNYLLLKFILLKNSFYTSEHLACKMSALLAWTLPKMWNS